MTKYLLMMGLLNLTVLTRLYAQDDPPRAPATAPERIEMFAKRIERFRELSKHEQDPEKQKLFADLSSKYEEMIKLTREMIKSREKGKGFNPERMNQLRTELFELHKLERQLMPPSKGAPAKEEVSLPPTNPPSANPPPTASPATFQTESGFRVRLRMEE